VRVVKTCTQRKLQNQHSKESTEKKKSLLVIIETTIIYSPSCCSKPVPHLMFCRMSKLLFYIQQK